MAWKLTSLGDNLVIVSIAPEIALEGSRNYAGGLGVLIADKFYAAGDMGIDYVVFSLFYRHGYVNVKFESNTPQFEDEDHEESFYSKLTPEKELIIQLRGANIYVRPWIYKYKTARAVLFEATCPEWARKLTEHVYLEESEEEKFLKYALLAKATAKYLAERVGLSRVTLVDLEESYSSLVLYALSIQDRARIIIHTPGPWGHPVFRGDLVSSEFQANFSGLVNMTEKTLEVVKEAIVVSEKQLSIISSIFPRFRNKLKHITNGIYLERWMHPQLLDAWRRKDFRREVLISVKREVKKALLNTLRRYNTHLQVSEEDMIVTWARRLTRYKRPYFISRFVEELAGDLNCVVVLAGKPHPRDPDGVYYLKTFKELSDKLNRVVFIPDYSTETAKLLVQGSDLWLFTPFSGWEACGTSYMKALVNGTPVLSSRDGGALEVIEDNVTGWFFGRDLREFVDIYNDPRAKIIDEEEYSEFRAKLLRIIDMYYNDYNEYLNVALNAWMKTPEKVDVKRALRKYYFEYSGSK
jgi:starch phosphorylase